ncbi:MAG: helix-turn-helix domain-containing protein [Chloroflexota bacterium]
MDTPELLHVSDVAKRLGLRRSRVYQLVAAGVVPSVRIGGSIRIPARAFEAWVERCNEKALSTCQQPEGGTLALAGLGVPTQERPIDWR